MSRLCVSHDEAHLFTASEDGQLFMFELLGEGAAQRERSRRNQEDAGQELDTVLVSKAELLERIAAAEELEQKVRLHCMVHRVVHRMENGIMLWMLWS